MCLKPTNLEKFFTRLNLPNIRKITLAGDLRFNIQFKENLETRYPKLKCKIHFTDSNIRIYGGDHDAILHLWKPWTFLLRSVEYLEGKKYNLIKRVLLSLSDIPEEDIENIGFVFDFDYFHIMEENFIYKTDELVKILEFLLSRSRRCYKKLTIYFSKIDYSYGSYLEILSRLLFIRLDYEYFPKLREIGIVSKYKFVTNAYYLFFPSWKNNKIAKLNTIY